MSEPIHTLMLVFIARLSSNANRLGQNAANEKKTPWNNRKILGTFCKQFFPYSFHSFEYSSLSQRSFSPTWPTAAVSMETFQNIYFPIHLLYTHQLTLIALIFYIECFFFSFIFIVWCK